MDDSCEDWIDPHDTSEHTIGQVKEKFSFADYLARLVDEYPHSFGDSEIEHLNYARKPGNGYHTDLVLLRGDDAFLIAFP